MSKPDGRRLSHETREQIRLRVVQQVAAGESPEVLARALGFHRSCVYAWLARYREGGLDALSASPITGRPGKLADQQLARLYQIISTENPVQRQFTFALWTRAMIRELIRVEFTVQLSDVSVGRLLKKLGLLPQKVWWRDSQHDSETVRRWRNEIYPGIRRQAKRAGATVCFVDISAIRSDYDDGPVRSLRRKKSMPSGKNHGLPMNLVSAISAQGAVRFMACESRLTANILIDFIQRLHHDIERPVWLIFAAPPVRQSAAVREFLASGKGQVKLFIMSGNL
ncbi:MAG: IS630 family transposase [Gammaproteobacteria bacterium]|jgi:transposase|nr:IS630 family transposase [Chromatiales bacterium]MDP6673795.1 IS630 family transposase [Gammaproteobacteria bacterium]